MQKLSGTSKENHNRSQVINEAMTDESNDVVFVDDSVPKSFKNLFTQDQYRSDGKQNTTTLQHTTNDIDQEKDKQNKDLSSKSKNEGNGNATKRTDWDMFAEQDIDSNFDVSL